MPDAAAIRARLESLIAETSITPPDGLLKERGGIITQLPAPEIASVGTVRAGNKKVLTALKRELQKPGLSPKKVDEHLGSITAFADRLLEQTPPVFLLDATPALLADYDAQNAVNSVSFKRFIRFLRDTGRVDPDEAEALLAVVKR